MENKVNAEILVSVNDIQRMIYDKDCSVDQLSEALLKYHEQVLKNQQRGIEDIDHEVVQPKLIENEKTL